MRVNFALSGKVAGRLSDAGLATLIGSATGLFIFGHLIGFGLVSAGSPFWVAPSGDLSIMMTGFEAIIHQGWSFPPTVTRLIDAPHSVSIVYTDSIPWLALAFKATGVWRWLNPFGLCWLIDYALQPVAMVALLRACGIRRLPVLLVGAWLALLVPAWLVRHGHVALTAHWILLFALALSVSSAREGLTPWRIAAFTGLGVLAMGIHAYHLPPVAMCLAAAIAAEVLQARNQAWRTCSLACASFLVGVGLSAWVLGYGADLGSSPGTNMLGIYSMNVVGPFLPQGSTIFGDRLAGGWFAHTIDPTGGQAFEGFAYMGAGLLFLIGAATALCINNGWFPSGAVNFSRRHLPLVVGLVALTVLAIGPIPYLGTLRLGVFEVPSWMGFLNALRSHGRFIWLVEYALVAAALVVVEREASLRWTLVLLAVALGLQITDTYDVRKEVRSAFRSPTSPIYPSEWNSAATLEGRPWLFAPISECASDQTDRTLISELSLLAIRMGGSSNATQTAHGRSDGCVENPQIARAARAGDRTVTVVLERSAPDLYSGVGSRPDCKEFDRGLLCGGGLSSIGGLRPHLAGSDPIAAQRASASAVTPVGRDIDLTSLGSAGDLLGGGWSRPERIGTWTEAREALLLLRFPSKAEGPLRLTLQAYAFTAPSNAAQSVTASIEGRQLAQWTVAKGARRSYSVAIPASDVKRGSAVLQLDIPGATSPLAARLSADSRRLGINVQSLRLDPG